MLVRQGFVQRTVNAQDRCQILLELTDDGNTLLDAITLKTRCWMLEFFSPLTPNELETVIQAGVNLSGDKNNALPLRRQFLLIQLS